MSEQPEKTPAAPMKELTGQRIGKYDIQKPLGKGAMGMVYLAHDTVLERDVALKVMVSTIADDPELKHRFEREAKAVAKMTHPNVVNVFDLGNAADGSPFIAMELLKGMDLQKGMRATPPMTLERKVNVMIQVLSGLAHAHQAGIVHRDIKPANVFLNQDGTAKIMDFGVARLTTASMTGTGNIVGTADYMSPEQVKGAKVDGRSDLFSVGCMLYELLAGKRPFHSENLMAIFYKITHEEPAWNLIPEGPEYEALMPILRKALAKDLEERYQTAYDFAQELKEYLKAHATGEAAEHALAGLVDLGPPPSTPPQPLTDASGPTLVTEDVGGSGVGLSRTVASAPTVARAATAAGASRAATLRGSAATVVGGAPTRAGGAAPTIVRPTAPAPVARPAPHPPAPAGTPMLYVILGVMAVAIVGIGAFLLLKPDKPQVVVIRETPPPTPVPTPPPPTLAVTPPPTTAPPPTLGPVEGKGAAAVRNAQAAFQKGDYDRAVDQAQAALREDATSATARTVLQNAMNGQKAAQRFDAARSALARGDFATAESEARAGAADAPWDASGPRLMTQIQDARQRATASAAQQQAQQQAAQRSAQINDILGKADAALSGQQYDAAISLFDSALGLDPANQRAILGKSSAVQARALAQAAAAGGGARVASGKTFAVGKTSATAAESTAGNIPPGFEESAGVAVKKGTQAAELPGRIGFDVEPSAVKPGDTYTVKITLLNEGSAPIQVKEMVVTTTTNGRRVSGPVPPQVKDVAPGQRANLISLAGNVWKEDTQSWAMEVVVKTSRGEIYKNQVTWR
ncbi:MAG TPA: serine/threonine-protein kinase [Vicinamibacteria bacterium]|nr:serine/threonine-protein kinase [Vicinamibacteria bacterium]